MACMHGIRVNLYHNHNECTTVLCTFREKAYRAPGEGKKPPATRSFNLPPINEVSSVNFSNPQPKPRAPEP